MHVVRAVGVLELRWRVVASEVAVALRSRACSVVLGEDSRSIPQEPSRCPVYGLATAPPKRVVQIARSD